ncbi:MAG: T9SS type A sorting domain-containing protein [Saprospirales bacterium]|nr:T9SS type A sorting domain-containing protein [Saprospirales bacterium]
MLPDLVNEGSAVQQIRYFSCADSTEVRFLKIINGGHTWPGGAGLTGIGNTNRDIQASREIWAFFSRFSLPGTSVTFEPIAAAVFQAFPNPTNDHIEVRGLDKSESVRLRLFDLRGLLLLETTGTSTLDLGSLPAGQYILYVQNGRQERLLAVQLMH